MPKTAELTDSQKHAIADRLALWVSAGMDLHSSNDIMRQLIREWLDFQTDGPLREARPPADKQRRYTWRTVFGATICALALHDLLGVAGKATAAWLVVNGWLP